MAMNRGSDTDGLWPSAGSCMQKYMDSNYKPTKNVRGLELTKQHLVRIASVKNGSPEQDHKRYNNIHDNHSRRKAIVFATIVKQSNIQMGNSSFASIEASAKL